MYNCLVNKGDKQMTALEQLGKHVESSVPLKDEEKQQAARYILNTVGAMTVAAGGLQVFAFDPNSKECKEAIMELAEKADFIIQMTKLIYQST